MSTEIIAITLLVGAFALLMVLRVGIGIAMGGATIITMLYLKLPISVVFQGMISGTKVFTFMAVPFFVLAGELMSGGGISKRLIHFAEALVGWVHGGAGMVNVLASMFFGGISGSAAADTASLGPIEIEMMTEQGYDKEFSTCLTMASSVQGMLIPPSHNMVVYAVTAGGVSIGALFLAGLVPGVFLGLALMVYSYYIARKNRYTKSEKFSLKRVLKTGWTAMFGLMTIVIIVLGVSGGIMTATESAAIAVLWSFVVSVWIYKDMSIKDYYKIATKTVKTLSIIMILIAVAYSFGWTVTYLGIPKMIASGLLALTSNKIVLLLLLNIVLLLLGMVMSMSSIILILTPILVPVLTALGVDLVHFGVVMVLNLGMGLLTPPVGGVLYIGSAISGVKVGRLTRSMVPFYVLMFSVLLFLTYVPAISTFLPNLVLGR
ncbi:TRAP transporter large permease [Cellulosilyticum sp. I15G10I2]|uniref:TRAP transporter large permease n=1 Tax=Cellulosilyticum sp. I15G10I2 TaxID=1892843 RepID=UPI00085CDE35|nr:TRAP transporter large permease [Cellulosilyticum sp. I15G10I2]